MGEEKLKQFYELASKDYDLPDYDTFKTDMQDEKKRSDFYKVALEDYDLPDYDTFSKDMTAESKKNNDRNGFGFRPQFKTPPQFIEPAMKVAKRLGNYALDAGNMLLESGIGAGKIIAKGSSPMGMSQLVNEGGTIEGASDLAKNVYNFPADVFGLNYEKLKTSDLGKRVATKLEAKQELTPEMQNYLGSQLLIQAPVYASGEALLAKLAPKLSGVASSSASGATLDFVTSEGDIRERLKASISGLLVGSAIHYGSKKLLRKKVIEDNPNIPIETIDDVLSSDIDYLNLPDQPKDFSDIIDYKKYSVFNDDELSDYARSVNVDITGLGRRKLIQAIENKRISTENFGIDVPKNIERMLPNNNLKLSEISVDGIRVKNRQGELFKIEIDPKTKERILVDSNGNEQILGGATSDAYLSKYGLEAIIGKPRISITGRNITGEMTGGINAPKLKKKQTKYDISNESELNRLLSLDENQRNKSTNNKEPIRKKLSEIIQSLRQSNPTADRTNLIRVAKEIYAKYDGKVPPDILKTANLTNPDNPPFKVSEQPKQEAISVNEQPKKIDGVKQDTAPIGEQKGLFIDQPEQVGSRESRFANVTAQENEILSPEALNKIKESPPKYIPNDNEATVQSAKNFVERDFESAKRKAQIDPIENPLDVSIAMEVAKKLDDGTEANVRQSVYLLDKVSQSLTKAGQSIQQIQAYLNKRSGTFHYWQIKKMLDSTESVLPKRKLEEFSSKKQKMLEGLQTEADDIASLPDGRDKEIAIARLYGKAMSLVPVSLAKKVDTFQTIAQLLNTKTITRNIISNLAFKGAENTATALATPIDVALSKYSGVRSTGIPSIKEQVSGFKKGAKEAVEEIGDNVNLGKGGQNPDYTATSAFKSEVGKGFQKALRYGLEVPDRAFWESTYKDSLSDIMKQSDVTKPEQWMSDLAHAEANYSVFQDDTTIGRALEGIKKSIKGDNESVVRTVLANLVLKYPKTPGSLLQKGLSDYSLYGVVKSIYKTSQWWKEVSVYNKLIKELSNSESGANKELLSKINSQKVKVFEAQRKLSKTITRGATGTSLMALGGYLYANGILTSTKTGNYKDQKYLSENNITPYQFNGTKFTQLALTGNSPGKIPNSGDNLGSFDWLMPMSIPLVVGAETAKWLKENNKSLNDEAKQEVATVLNSLATGAEIAGTFIGSSVDVFQNQPTAQGLRMLGGSKNLSESLSNALMTVPESYVPSVIAQLRNLSDDLQRETFSPDAVENMKNRILNKFPALSKTLPVKTNAEGEPLDTYGGDNSFFNVMFSPAFLRTYKPSENGKESLRLFLQDEDTRKGINPVYDSKKYTVGGVTYDLTKEQFIELKQFSGDLYSQYIDELIKSPEYANATDEERKIALRTIINSVGDITKAHYIDKYLQKGE